jgi:uncharacterized protein YicC (UPF0701 family)
MTVEERLYKLEGIVEGVMAVLPDRVSALEARMDLLRQEVKAEINTAFNKAILYFTGIAVVLGILTLLR